MFGVHSQGFFSDCGSWLGVHLVGYRDLFILLWSQSPGSGGRHCWRSQSQRNHSHSLELVSWPENSIERAADHNQILPSPPCHVMRKRNWVYFEQRKESFKSWQRSPLVQSTLLHLLSKKVLYLVFEFEVLFFSEQNKASGRKTLYPSSFLPNITQNDLPVTWGALRFPLLLWRFVRVTGIFTQMKLLPEKQKFDWTMMILAVRKTSEK